MKPLRLFEEVRIKNKTKNEINRELLRRINVFEKIAFERNIKDNPILKQLKKDDWIVNVNNKCLIRWACKITLQQLKSVFQLDDLIFEEKIKRLNETDGGEE